MKQKLWPALALAPIVLALAGCAGMQTKIPSWGPDLAAVTPSNKVITFNHTTPGTIESSAKITGLQTGENVVAIDYRPGDGKLYALGSSGRLYALNVATGAASLKATLHAVAGDAFSALSGASFGISFNPVDGLLTVVSDAGQNLRVNADTGEVTTRTAFDASKASLIAAAYTTKPNGPFKTTLYLINSKGSEIDSSLSPNDGTFVTVGAVGSDIDRVGGLDIVGNESGGVAYAAMAAPDAKAPSKLYLIKLGAGAAKGQGTIGGGEKVRSLAIRPSLES